MLPPKPDSQTYIENAADSRSSKAFFHVNDIHAHLDEFTSSGSDCDEPEEGCYGGYARIKSKVDELRDAHPDSLWLNAGDEFQGTLYYSFYKGEKIAETLNDLDFDVMTLGNHEWDGGEEELGEFLANLTFPIVAANVRSENEQIKPYIEPYHVFEDKKLAVIGAVTTETPSIADVGDKTEFVDPIKAIQEAIYEIRNETDVKYIVALTHLGYEVDMELGEKTEGLSLIIGAHSHTLLGDMEDAEGKYPTIVNNTAGDEVFIVTSYRWGEYLGSISLRFDEQDGSILGYYGAPIHLTNTTSQDDKLQEQIEEWRGPFEEFASEVLGETNAELGQEDCQDGDCLLGQVMADAMLEYRVNLTEGSDTTAPDFALVNAGGIRATIDEGEITRGEVLTSFPFGNAIVELEYNGSEVRSIFEGAVSMVNQFNDEEIGSWFQVSRGVKVEYNPDNDAGSRLVNVTIDGKPIDNEADYRIVTLDFLAGGGDNIFVETSDFASLDLQDEVLIQYIEAHSPLEPELEERVVKTDAQPSEDDNSNDSGSGDDSSGDSGDDSGNDSGEGNGDGNGEGAAGMLAAPFWTVLAVGAVMATL